jgi:DNA-binding beta-propeller fold protein YncE/predicted small lipoprotein YifL
MLGPIRRLALATLCAALAGCGSLGPERTPKAAEPAAGPPLRDEPVGQVVDVGNLPEGVAADPVTGRVAVGLRDPDEIALLDGATGAVQQRVRVPGPPRHLSLARPGGPVLVPAESANALVQIPVRGGRERATRVNLQPHDATFAAGRIWVGDERSDTVTVLEGDRRVKRFAVARQPGGLAPADAGRTVAVVSVRDRVLELFDARTYRRLGKVNAGVGPTHVVSDGRETLFVTDTAGDALLVFRTKPELILVRRLAMRTSPYGIAIDTRRKRLFVTLTGTNRLIKLWTNGPYTVADLPTVRQPDTVAVDETTGRAFVTGRTEGVLQLVDPGDREPESASTQARVARTP